MEDRTVNVFWFRRDLRVTDNHGFCCALTAGKPVVPVFIFDTGILNDLEDNDPRLGFILSQVNRLQKLFEEAGSSLWIYHGTPLDAFKRLHAEYHIDTVFYNQDYEPTALARDRLVTGFLGSVGIRHHSSKDHVIFHQNEILNESGKPYSVFTPYCRKWRSLFTAENLQEYQSEKYLHRLLRMPVRREWGFFEVGFRPGAYSVPPLNLDPGMLERYEGKRDYPGEDGTTRMGIYLRFGTLSIRKVTALALAYSPALLNELIWRNFYIDILWHFPQVVTGAFNRTYDRLNWINSEKDFDRWCEGSTGFPMVDAGMRQLNSTGFMHNRARMIVASFLCKHLLIDWRWGEAYFAGKLLDYELASNNGGWQWAAGSGCDATPYFRVFNPELQQKKFDPDGVYVRRWVPEAGTALYPKPIIDHRTARVRAIRVYRESLSGK